MVLFDVDRGWGYSRCRPEYAYLLGPELTESGMGWMGNGGRTVNSCLKGNFDS